MRDVMRRIGASGEDDAGAPASPSTEMADMESLRDSLRFLGPESSDLSRQVERALRRPDRCRA